MKLDEMQIQAEDVLTYFLQVMSEAPFTKDDIIFAFANKSEMISRALELCTKYCPELILNDSQLRHLEESVTANALIGREKSAVLFRKDSRLSKKDFRRIIFHELMHIYCAKIEMDDEHFIDIYGTGTTPDCDPDEIEYDGIIVAGYVVWSEFIAHYYAIKMIDKPKYKFNEIAHNIAPLFADIHAHDLEASKGSFSMICSHWLNCVDAEKSIEALQEPDMLLPSDESYAEETQATLYICMRYLHNHMQNEQPWKIDEDFIFALGSNFNSFRIYNSMYLMSNGNMDA